MTNLQLDYDSWEYQEFQDPTPKDLDDARADGFTTMTSKVINVQIQNQTGELEDKKIVTVLMRKPR
jgi:hypothetical protein